MRLADLGWNDALETAYAPGRGTHDTQPGRVAIEFNQIFRIYVAGGELDAVTAGRLKHRARNRAELPAVGDWVVLRKRAHEDRGVIVDVLPRRSAFTRRAAGDVTGEQVVAANVDVVFVVMGLDADFNVRRLERYLLMARESGAAPVILLTKPDLADDVAARVLEVVALAGNLPVHVLQPRSGEGVDLVRAHLAPGRTAALLGSSGVGKSTITNRLLGADVRRTREVRPSDSRGRHTTMHRELVVLPDGGLIIDTPGMRELQLWETGEAVNGAFADIDALAAECRFRDCRHQAEPGCAVHAAVASGMLPQVRLDSFHKLQGEQAFQSEQQDERARLERKRAGRIGAKALRARLRDKGA